MTTPHPTTLLLDSIFEAIRDAMSSGDQALADALAKVLSRATQTSHHVERRATVLKRPFGSGDGLDLLAIQAREARARLYRPTKASPARTRTPAPVREPNPAPLGLGVVPSRQLNRPTFLR